MGLFGFNAEKKIKKAQELVAGGRDYDARKVLLELKKNATKLNGADQAWVVENERLVRERMVAARMEEARKYELAGEIAAARDRAETALDLAGDDLETSNIHELLHRLGSSRRESGGSPESLPSDLLPDRPDREQRAHDPEEPTPEELWGDNLDEVFELYMDALPAEQANLYREQADEFKRAYVSLVQGAPKLALTYFDELVWDPLPPDSIGLERARALLLAKRAEESVELLDAIGSEEAAFRWAKIEALRELDRFDDAVAEAAALVNSLPEHNESTDALYAWTLIDAGRPEEAWTHLEGWVQSGTMSEEVLVAAAQAATQTGRSDEAAEFLEGLIQFRFHSSLQSGRPPSFPVEAGRRLLSIYIDREEEPAKTKALVMHLLDYDPHGGEAYRDLLLRLDGR